MRDGEPCSHRGCLNHITHPCEGCGRIAGVSTKDYWNTLDAMKFLMENPESNMIFICEQREKKIDMYLDDLSNEIFIDYLPNGIEGWIYQTNFTNIELNQLLYIKNWERHEISS